MRNRGSWLGEDSLWRREGARVGKSGGGGGDEGCGVEMRVAGGDEGGGRLWWFRGVWFV